MDFVLRDAYMSGYSARAFDLDRLLRYSFFSPAGLTIHSRGVDALVRFMGVRAELFRSVYFHRTVRAIDPVSNIPEFKICAVRVSKVAAPDDPIARLEPAAGGVR